MVSDLARVDESLLRFSSLRLVNRTRRRSHAGNGNKRRLNIKRHRRQTLRDVRDLHLLII